MWSHLKAAPCMWKRSQSVSPCVAVRSAAENELAFDLLRDKESGKSNQIRLVHARGGQPGPHPDVGR